MMLVGEIQTRVFDFIRVWRAIHLEMKTGLQISSQGSALKAARIKGYVPEKFSRRRKAAYEYMGHVARMLGAGSGLAILGEEIVMGRMVYSDTSECGCHSFIPADGETNRLGILPHNQILVCEHQEG